MKGYLPGRINQYNDSLSLSPAQAVGNQTTNSNPTFTANTSSPSFNPVTSTSSSAAAVWRGVEVKCGSRTILLAILVEVTPGQWRGGEGRNKGEGAVLYVPWLCEAVDPASSSLSSLIVGRWCRGVQCRDPPHPHPTQPHPNPRPPRPAGPLPERESIATLSSLSGKFSE